MVKHILFVRMGAVFTLLFCLQAGFAADTWDNLLHYYPYQTDYNDAVALYFPGATPSTVTVLKSENTLATADTVIPVSAVGGPMGTYYHFSADGYLDLGVKSDEQFDTTKSLSIAWWGMLAANSGANATFVSNKDWGNRNNHGYILSRDKTNAWLSIGNGSTSLNLWPATIALENWYFYATTIDRDTNELIQYYGDTAGNMKTMTGSLSGVATFYANRNWKVGADTLGNYRLSGGMSDLSMWDTTLSEQEVLSMYRAGLNGMMLGDLQEVTPSARTGNWSDTGSWDTTWVVEPLKNVRVNAGHAITADKSAAVNRVEIADGGSLVVASGATLAASNLLTVRSGATLDIQGEMTAPDVWIPGGEIALSGKLTLAEPHINDAPTRNIPLLNVTGPSAELSHQEDVTLAETHFANGAALTKSGVGTLSIGSQAPGAKFVVAEGVVQTRSGTTFSGTTFDLAGGSMVLAGNTLLDTGYLNKYRAAESLESANTANPNTTTHVTGTRADGTISTMFAPTSFTSQGLSDELMNWTVNSGTGNASTSVWTGYFTAADATDSTVTYKMHYINDDSCSFWIDLNQDGVFQAEERQFARGWNNSAATVSFDLVPGETYATALIQVLGGGQDRLLLKMTTAGNDVSQDVYYFGGSNGANNGGTWSAGLLGDYSDTTFNVKKDTQLALQANRYILGEVAFQADKTLEFLGGDQQEVAIRRLSGSGKLDFNGTIALGVDDASQWLVGISDDGIDGVHFAADLLLGGQLIVAVDNTATDPLDPMTDYLIGLVDGDLLLDNIRLEDILLGSVNNSADMTGASLWFDDSIGGIFLSGLSGSSASAVPEPATWLMLVLGVLVLGVWRRKSRIS